MQISKKEAATLVFELKKIFDTVRFVDASRNIQYEIKEDGEMVASPYKCYIVWNKSSRCDNCISAKVFATKERMTKYEFVGNDIYYIVAKYVVIEDTEYVLEIVSKATDELLFGALGKDRFINSIISYNNKLYKDVMTGAHNRQYYEEQLKFLPKAPAVAMFDIDNFKSINDTYGHATGDDVLKAVVSQIRQGIRSSDQIIRYGGDEFLLVFPDAGHEGFYEMLDELRKRVCQHVFYEYPGLSVSISIGGCIINGPFEKAIRIADEMMYRAKKTKNTVCCMTE